MYVWIYTSHTQVLDKTVNVCIYMNICVYINICIHVYMCVYVCLFACVRPCVHA